MMKINSPDKRFFRKFLALLLIVLVCLGGYVYFILKLDSRIILSQQRVIETRRIIDKAERLALLMEGMISSRHAYLLTANETYLSEYNAKKEVVSQTLAWLSEIVSDNPAQMSRLDEMRQYFVRFSETLDRRTGRVGSDRVFQDELGEPNPKS